MNKDTHIVVCLGPVLSGKTRWTHRYLAENPEYWRLSLDEMRVMFRGELEDVNEDFKRVYRQFVITTFVNYKKVLLDDYFLDMQQLLGLANTSQVTLKLMDVTMKEAMTRNIKRKRDENVWKDPAYMIDYRNRYNTLIRSSGFEQLLRRTNVEVLIDEAVDSNLYFTRELVY